MRKYLERFVLLLAGALLALFGVGPAVFADGTSSERMVVMLITIAIYGLLGLAAGYFLSAWTWGVWLSIPALLVLLVFGENMALAVTYLGLIVVVACLGAGAGSRLRPSRS